ncbi:PREDICTED: neuroligin-2-like [Branchiostoma belcheri]|uniref:Bile salt-activated lipase n=1 Tax=Branchiostoma belcheri TaxID=7741 RepID=A0A6P5AC23_BRABE|nr:PREDICTED: neuroligin-2-like [Branchiostoma belcheri]
MRVAPVVLLLFSVSCSFCAGDEVVVPTTYGDVRGFELRNVRAFFGIPYARPPLGGLRFKEPLPPSSWTGVRDATKFGPDCPQKAWFLMAIFNRTHQISEDCLYLNVYSPNKPADSGLHPVLVVIHGGSYRRGSGREYDGAVLAERGTVVVTLNFRLGALGWLSTEDESALGNFGLLDQIEALKWVQMNIKHFGGDPDRVTIMGCAAGASSAALHLTSIYSAGLFHGMILSSGSLVNPWTVLLPPYRPYDHAADLAEKLGCPTESTEDLVNCLRQKTAEELVETSVEGPPMISVWAPVVDGPGGVIPDSPTKLLAKGAFSKVPLLMGTASKEMSYIFADVKGIEFGVSSDMVDEMRSRWVERYPSRARRYIKDIISFEYTDFKNMHDPAALRDNYIKFKTDYGYHSPMLHQANAHSGSGAPTWVYVLDYRSENNPRPKWMGTMQADDQVFIFGPGTLMLNDRFRLTDRDREVTDMMRTFVTNFVRFGNPSPQSQPLEWKMFHGDQQSYLQVRKPGKTRMKDYFKTKVTALWTSYVPETVRRVYNVSADDINPFGGSV